MFSDVLLLRRVCVRQGLLESQPCKRPFGSVAELFCTTAQVSKSVERVWHHAIFVTRNLKCLNLIKRQMSLLKVTLLLVSTKLWS